MTLIVLLLFILINVLVCEGRIDVPGLGDIEKCRPSDTVCTRVNTEKLVKALSKPFPKYEVEGYDPFMIDSLVLFNPQFDVDQYLSDIVVTGYGDSKVSSVSIENAAVRAVFESNLTFVMKGKVVFRQHPEVFREGVISGEFVGLRSYYHYTYDFVPRGAERHLRIVQAILEGVELANPPNLMLQNYAPFVSSPQTYALVSSVWKKILDNPIEFYKPVAEALIQRLYAQHVNDRNNFQQYVPVSEFLKL